MGIRLSVIVHGLNASTCKLSAIFLNVKKIYLLLYLIALNTFFSSKISYVETVEIKNILLMSLYNSTDLPLERLLVKLVGVKDLSYNW